MEGSTVSTLLFAQNGISPLTITLCPALPGYLWLLKSIPTSESRPVDMGMRLPHPKYLSVECPQTIYEYLSMLADTSRHSMIWQTSFGPTTYWSSPMDMEWLKQ